MNLHQSDLKLLVLDDLLVSLDMSNRMAVVDILLSDQFAGYQQIILTHDLGLFREFERRLGSRRADWHCIRLRGTARETITAINEKTDLQKAEDYLAGYQLDEAAQSLRKAAEKLAKRYRELLDGTSLPPGEFFSLTQNLRAARTRLVEELPVGFYQKFLKTAPATNRELVIPADDSDLDAVAELDGETRGRLKSQRRMLRKLISKDHADTIRRIRLLDHLLACTGRVLNPAAHAGDPPIYEAEVPNALDLIQLLASETATT
ncbi:MAG: hypothetical protein O3A00_26440 [Planctomycetota bacterium]|nr:hypothetical protein [Planctomycetota bacterium]